MTQWKVQHHFYRGNGRGPTSNFWTVRRDGAAAEVLGNKRGRSKRFRSEEVLVRGFTWNWEGRPPKGGHSPAQQHLFAPMCTGCIKSAVVQEELA